MITHYKVDGYENLLKLIEIIDCKGSVILYFCGSPNPLGQSWSLNCNRSASVFLYQKLSNGHLGYESEVRDSDYRLASPGDSPGGPIVHAVLKKNETKNFHFVHVGVGTYNEWKDPYCPFKTHEKLQLRSLPTLIYWRHPEKLSGKECIDEEKVKELIEGLP